MGLVILPQALKMVIPGIVNTFISLFKDTTLVLIIGLFDVLGTVQSTVTDPRGKTLPSKAMSLSLSVSGSFASAYPATVRTLNANSTPVIKPDG